MEQKTIGILKDISQLVIGTLVEETDEWGVLEDARILGISSKNSQVNINFIPLDLLSLDPIIGLKNMAKDPNENFKFKFVKNNVLLYDVALADNVVENYRKSVGRGVTEVIPPNSDNIVKLF